MKAIVIVFFFLLSAGLFYAGLPETVSKGDFYKLAFGMFFSFVFGFSLCSYGNER